METGNVEIGGFGRTREGVCYKKLAVIMYNVESKTKHWQITANNFYSSQRGVSATILQ